MVMVMVIVMVIVMVMVIAMVIVIAIFVVMYLCDTYYRDAGQASGTCGAGAYDYYYILYAIML